MSSDHSIHRDTLIVAWQGTQTKKFQAGPHNLEKDGTR